MLAKRGRRSPLPKFSFSRRRCVRSRGTRSYAFIFALAVISILAGCAKKKTSRAAVERITQEIVASARKILGPKSQIEIRPLMHASGSAAQFADAIYMSTSSASQTRSLEDAMGRVARRHDLSIARSASDGVVVLDFSSRGIPTHSIHIVTPLTFEYGSSASRGPRLAIIVDDMGYDRAAVHSVLALPFRVTVSVIPHLPLSAEVAEEAFRRGDEVILHLPMQSVPSAAQQERIELRVGMNAQQVQSILAGMLETVPHVVGVNNHEGSLATADPALMNELMPDLRARGLFFIDSRTTAATVAYTAAEQAGVRAAARKVFLDDTVTVSAVRKQIELAARDAEKNGSAISIGHPHPATIAALAATVPQLEKCGIRLVFASDLVH